MSYDEHTKSVRLSRSIDGPFNESCCKCACKLGVFFSFVLAILRQLTKSAREPMSNRRTKRALGDNPSYYAKYVDYNQRRYVELILVLDTLVVSVSVFISALVAVGTFMTRFSYSNKVT
jgi:hypothetical protein